jgi:hypothetical protein
MESKLLSWATQHCNPDQDDGVAPKELTKFDPELVEMILGRDHAVVMRELTGRVGHARTTPQDEKEALLELLEIIEDLDCAKNMHKMNLWPSIFEAYHSGENKALALSAISVAAQNNPQVQSDLMGLDVFEKILFDGLRSEEEGVALKAVSATSAMIRNERFIYDSFVGRNGRMLMEETMTRHPATSDRIQHLLSYTDDLFNE